MANISMPSKESAISLAIAGVIAAIAGGGMGTLGGATAQEQINVEQDRRIEDLEERDVEDIRAIEGLIRGQKYIIDSLNDIKEEYRNERATRPRPSINDNR